MGQVRQLIEAENERNKTKADYILAQNFTAITRSSGIEENRAKLLDKIENPDNPNIHREIDNHDFWIRESGNLGVIRTLLTTKDSENPQAASRRFRNIHVFEKQPDGDWRCTVWQVTEIKAEK